ncbi:hypothetical protein ACSSNL_13295 [Thalassobius sp. S69A]|uniref:hypothetical protein n=1 Tax=unclassified Thalassovita TaxID=2619711 RepID=UPI003C7C79F4
MGNIALITVPGVSSAANLQKLTRDPVLKGAGNGALFGFDLSFDWSYDAETAPANAKTVRSIASAWDATDAEILAAAGEVQIRAGQTLTNAGGGLDFSAVTRDANVVRGPAGVLAPLQAAQEFCVISWFKMPSQADWNSGSTIAPIFTTSDANGYPAGPDLLTICQEDDPLISARRQTNGAGTIEKLEIADLTNFYGQVTQVMYARTASQSYFRLKSALGEVTVTGAAGALNTGDLTGLRPQWGVVEAFNNLLDGSSFAEHQDASNYRLYRGYIENLAVSGRAPIALADESWTKVSAMHDYS